MKLFRTFREKRTTMAAVGNQLRQNIEDAAMAFEPARKKILEVSPLKITIYHSR